MRNKFFLLFLVSIISSSILSSSTALAKGSFVKSYDPTNTIYLIDGSGFLYRAYYGVRPLHTSKGIPVQAVYSFCRMIKKFIDTFQPQHCVLVWDSKGKTTRHTLFQEYKASRQAAPSDLFEQKKHIQQFADLIGLKQLEQPGIEADDLLYSLAQDYSAQNKHVVLMTSDKDMAQMLNEHIVIFDPFKDEFRDKEYFENRFGFSIEKIPFYFALLGDSSDNIPGVKGIGQKGATQLVQQFAHLDDLYERSDAIPKERTRQLLLEQKDNAYLSHQLFLLQYHALSIPLEQVVFDTQQWHKARPLFQELEFGSLLKNIDQQMTTAPAQPFVPLSQSKGYEFICIQTPEQLTQLCQEIREYGIVAIDVEGIGLNPLEDPLVGICLSTHKGRAYYLPVGHITTEPQLERDLVFNTLKPLFEDPAIKKVMHHAKFDQHMLLQQGIRIKGLVFDTLVAAHLVTKDWQKIGLKSLSEFYLQERMLTFSEVVTNNKYKNMAHVPLTLATEYAASDAHQTLQLYFLLQDELTKLNMHELYYDIEHPLIEVLMSMELEGISLDQSFLHQLSIQAHHDLQTLHTTIIDLIGQEWATINLNSPKQVEALLFEHLKLPTQKKSTKRTGYSTDTQVLQELAKLHPVPGLLLKYRELAKLKSTYIDALPTYIHKKTGKVHTNFNQTGVATGRLSSSDPNMQNIPTQGPYNMHIRQAFTPAPGHVFISADYSQIELRILAHLSQDTALKQAFLQHQDIHTQTAARLFDLDVAQVTSEQRKVGKRINFSILYGLTPYGLSKDLNIPFKDAKKYIEKYFDQYPGVQQWMDAVIEQTKEHGYVTTYFGRRRFVPGIYEKNKVLYDLARRIAINTIPQGTAAEIMKKGMIGLHAALQEHALNAKLLLQIHDELLLSVPEHEVEATKEVIKTTLERVVQWDIPLEVNISVGTNWQHVTK